MTPGPVKEGLTNIGRTILTAIGRENATHLGFTARVEYWTLEQVQFATHARVAARRALYFVRLLEPDADEALINHVHRRVRETLEEIVRVPREKWCPDGAQGEYSGTFEDFEHLDRRWANMLAAGSAAPSLERLLRLDAELTEFMRQSLPVDGHIRWTYAGVPAIRLLLQQHMAFVVGLAAALAILFLVEPVLSLFRNRPAYGALAVLFAVSPGLLSGVLAAGLRRRGDTPFWDVGGRIGRSVLPVLMEPPPWIGWHPRDGRLVRRIYFGLAWKILLHLAAWGVLWLVCLALVRWFNVDAVLLTVYLIAVALAIIAFSGAAIDFADMHTQAPLRGQLIAGALMLAVVVVFTDSTGPILAVPLVWAALVTWWALRVRQRRVIAIVAVLAAVHFVATASTSRRHEQDRWPVRAAENVAYLSLAEWPRGGSTGDPIVVLAASGGGSRAAIMTARTLERLADSLPAISRNLQAISSVSGGSLANAAYLSRRIRALDSGLAAPACEANLTTSMQHDFLRPTLSSVFTGGGRAQGIQRDWEQCPVGLGNLTIGTLTRLWRDPAYADIVPFPVPIFNSVSLDRHAVVITPFGRELFSAPFDTYARAAPSESPTTQRRAPRRGTWVYYRSGIYHLAELTPTFDPKLSESVRASANFPFGFPLVEVATDQALWYSPREEDRTAGTEKIVRLTDGGALSNSGLWPLLPLLLRNRDDIRRRGVLLVIVDASRMPAIGARDRQLGLVGTILDKAPKSERMHLQLLEQLQQAYGQCFAHAMIAIEPLADYNVYTTWALDQGSQQLMNDIFETAWGSVRTSIESAYESVSRNARNGECAVGSGVSPRRVPLS